MKKILGIVFIGLVSRAKLETVKKVYALDKLKMFERTLFSDSIQ